MSAPRILSSVDVELIRGAYWSGTRTLESLASEYGVSTTAIWKVVNNRTHKGRPGGMQRV